MATPSFIFGGDTGETPESLKRKRELVNALLSQQIGTPKTIGEGLSALGKGLSGYLAGTALAKKTDAAEKAGQESGAEAFNPIVGSLAGFPAAPSANGGSAGASASADPSGYRDAIASIESAGSGDYGAVGPTNPKLGRALGRYQVMEANIGPWSKEALGREVTPQEFLENPKIQDAIFDHKFGSYVQKYGNPQDAASAWFTGQPLSVGANRRDVLGTSGNQYVDKFTRALGGRPDMDKLSVMAGGNAGALPPGAGQGGPSMAQLLAAGGNQWLNPNQSAIVKALLGQKMKEQDPARALDMEYKRAQLDALKNPVAKPTGDMQEYEFAKSQGFPGSFVDFMLAQKKAGATTISDIGNTKGETEYDKAFGKNLAEKTIGILDAGQQAPNKIATYNQILQTLPGMYTGTGGDTILSAKRALKGLGFDTGDLSGPEFIQAMGNQMALELRNPAGGAGMPGAMSDKDREFLASMSPGLTKTPEGNKKLLEYRIALEKRNQQVAQLANQYMNSHGGRIDNNFYSELSKWSEANPLFPDKESGKSKSTVIDGYTIEEVP